MPKEAEMLDYVFSMDVKALVISLFILAIVGVTIYGIVKKIQDIVGIETKSMREKRLMKESINEIKNEIDLIKKDQADALDVRRQFNQRMEDS